MHRAFAFLALILSAHSVALAQQFPKLTGRVVDSANLLSSQDEAVLTQKLQALEQTSSRQLVVATVPDLQGYPIEEFGYRLGRAWGIGQNEANNGTILLVAPSERKVRIEVGYGLEPILTDALSSLIVQNQILPRFRANDYPGGINAGADAIIHQLQAPPELAEQRALEAQQQAQAQQAARGGRSGGGGSILPLIFWGLIIFFVVLPMLRGGRGGRRHRRRGGGFPVILWGPGFGGGGGGGGFGGFGGGGGGGFGGFSGGGGSFGGGGASGGW